MSNRSVLLQAKSLFSKYGFGDGDMLGDYLMDIGYTGLDDREVLHRAVIRHLLPLLPDEVRLVRINTRHNATRGDWEEYNDFTPLPEPWASVEVELSERQIRDIADEVLAEQYGRKA